QGTYRRGDDAPGRRHTGGGPPVLRQRRQAQGITTRLSYFSLPVRRRRSTHNVRGRYRGGFLHLFGPTSWRTTVLGGCVGARRCLPSSSVRFSPSSPAARSCWTSRIVRARRARCTVPPTMRGDAQGKAVHRSESLPQKPPVSWPRIRSPWPEKRARPPQKVSPHMIHRTAHVEDMYRAELLRKYIREIPDFPSPGVLFKDITPLLNSSEALRE